MLPIENDKFGVSSIAEATKLVSVVTSVVGVMLVPALGGIWIDHLLGTGCLFVILGAIVGFVGGMYGLLHMVQGHWQELHPLEANCLVRNQYYNSMYNSALLGYLLTRRNTMSTFCVWIHPLANACKVRVLGIENAKWLLNRLTRSFLIKSRDIVNEEE